MAIRVSHFVIEPDNYGVVVYRERKKRKKGNKKEEAEGETTSLVGYYSSVSKALRRVLDEMVRDDIAESKSLKAILDSLEAGKVEMHELFKGLKCQDS